MSEQDSSLNEFVGEENQSLEFGPQSFQLPEQWDKTVFGRTFTHQRGVNYSSDNYVSSGEGMIFLTLNAIAPRGGLKKDSLKYYDDDINENKKTVEGDILLANTDLNQDGEIIGYPVRVPSLESEQEVCFSHHLLKIQQKESVYNTSFLECLLSAKYIHDRMIAFSCGSTVLNLNTGLLEKLEIPVPPHLEQRKIATVLHTVDQAIQRTEKIIESIERAKRGVLQDTIFDVDSKESVDRRFGPKIFQIPEHWQRVRLQEVTDLITRGKQPTYADEGVPVINQECIYWDGFHFENIRYLDETKAKEWKDKYFVSVGDVVINSTGRGTLGRAQTYAEDTERAVDSHVTIARPDTQKMTAGYLRYFLESNRGQGLLYSMCVTGSTGQIELSKSKLQLLSIPLPTKEEQKEIVNTLEQFDSNIRSQQKYKKQLDTLKQGLMQDLLSGEVRTTDANIHIPDEVEKYG